MRNVFDQYSQPENRLSHALAVCLHEDRALLRRFLSWQQVKPPCRVEKLLLGEQSLPGVRPDVGSNDDRQGLPDIVIHDEGRWCLFIESKIETALNADQLRRHKRTLERRGFTELVSMTLTKAGVPPARDTKAVHWPDLYQWLGATRQRSEWSERLRSFMRVLELQLVREGSLSEGTLTIFDGFPLFVDNMYNYEEAKRLVRLAMGELRRDSTLREMGVDPKAPGRPAIRGRRSTSVWDFLSLRDRPTGADFTSHFHLTLGLHASHVEVAITIPDKVDREVRRRLADLGADGLSALNSEILRRARPLLSLGATVQARVIQRHYPSQSAPAVTDAELIFDLHTSQRKPKGPVKWQVQWVQLFADLLRYKRANVQFQYCVVLPWSTAGLDSRASLGLIVSGWHALAPLISVLRGGNGPQ